MYFVGVDLHKHSISLCVMIQDSSGRRIIDRKRFKCEDTQRLADYFQKLGTFRVVVEATASYEWLFQLLEPLAERLVLAHPKKLRVIAESTKKTDKLDAQTLAEFLTLDMIPEAWRPTPRVRQHRTLVRLRRRTKKRLTSVKNSIRWVLAGYNADIKNPFSKLGRLYLSKASLNEADRFQVDLLLEELDQFTDRLKRIDQKLAEFATTAPAKEREARAVLSTIPGVGPVTIDVVLSELGDPQRFGSQRKATAFAGLAPGIRESAGRTKQLRITKDGSALLRWALVQVSWRVVNQTLRWRTVYERLKKKCGAKKAIVAVARRLWCVMIAMLQSGQAYRLPGQA
jgi:transposase